MTATHDTRATEGARGLGALAHGFASEFPELCAEFTPDRVPDPEVVLANGGLGEQLGIDPAWLAGEHSATVLSGDAVPDGAVPVAMGYAGHQFGNYSPRLGDGRAVLLGELVDAAGSRRDVHLKGTGRTPWARGGDGKATIGPMLREYVVAEAMAALGIPTTRALAVVTTGETVMRDGPEPGAVLTRIASSHIRVGTFEYAARLGGDELVRRLADHCIERHHPSARETENPYLGLLAAVVEAQADLVARWMLVGFIHGVMNTDNMTISGEGIDYGPCAFMDRYDPATVYSSIDHGGRYAFGNQPAVATWNLSRFAETMLGLIAQDEDASVELATAELRRFEELFQQRWNSGLSDKLGLRAVPGGDLPGSDPDLLGDLLSVMRSESLDWTSTFRRLAESLRAQPQRPESDPADPGIISIDTPVETWRRRWVAELDRQGIDSTEAADAMDAVNPLYIPRNHLLDEALREATGGSYGQVRVLIEVLSDPFTLREGQAGEDLGRFSEPAPSGFDTGFRTFCGT